MLFGIMLWVIYCIISLAYIDYNPLLLYNTQSPTVHFSGLCPTLFNSVVSRVRGTVQITGALLLGGGRRVKVSSHWA